MGCETPGGFVEESNFCISSIVMRVKLTGCEAGWIVKVTDVVDGER